jgi:hypothetical protein
LLAKQIFKGIIMGLKLRLVVMNFLQYAIWGAWLISLGAYLGGSLKFEGFQIGSFFATMGIASYLCPELWELLPTVGYLHRSCWGYVIFWQQFFWCLQHLKPTTVRYIH